MKPEANLFRLLKEALCESVLNLRLTSRRLATRASSLTCLQAPSERPTSSTATHGRDVEGVPEERYFSENMV